jgi:hypothetical protein
MNSAQQLLICTGIALIGCTMAFGVGYAIFDEHQTLVGMGVQMATGFMEAAQGNMNAAYAALDSYGAISAEYRSEVHSHGHWGMLALILIILGLAFDRLPFAKGASMGLAWLLAVSATLFPLGVLMQIGPLASIGKILSIGGSMGMIAGLLLVTVGLLKARSE